MKDSACRPAEPGPRANGDVLAMLRQVGAGSGGKAHSLLAACSARIKHGIAEIAAARCCRVFGREEEKQQ